MKRTRSHAITIAREENDESASAALTGTRSPRILVSFTEINKTIFSLLIPYSKSVRGRSSSLAYSSFSRR